MYVHVRCTTCACRLVRLCSSLALHAALWCTATCGVLLLVGLPARHDPRQVRPQDEQVAGQRHRSAARHQWRLAAGAWIQLQLQLAAAASMAHAQELSG